MKRIKLTQGKYAVVDDWSYGWLNEYKWYAVCHHNNWYAVRTDNKNRRQIKMHRVVLGLNHNDGKITDHRNCNGLDNREQNLRVVTNKENRNNRKILVKGCYWDKDTGKWHAYIRVNNKQHYLGYFDNENDAHHAYLKANGGYYKGD